VFGNGEVAEWLKAHAWKACLLERVTRVRIPVSPQKRSRAHLEFGLRFFFMEMRYLVRKQKAMQGLNSKMSVWIGMASASTILLGCVFKAFHLQGAAFVFIAGMSLFCFGFIPVLMVDLFKKGRIVLAMGSFFLSSLILGALFKVMHWPYANFLLSWSVSIILFGILPLHFLKTYRTKTSVVYPQEAKLRDVFLGILLMAFFATWYLLLDLSRIPSPYSLPL
jgi:hypothetical protein